MPWDWHQIIGLLTATSELHWVNNLPKTVTWKWNGRQSNPSTKSSALTTTPQNRTKQVSNIIWQKAASSRMDTSTVYAICWITMPTHSQRVQKHDLISRYATSTLIHMAQYLQFTMHWHESEVQGHQEQSCPWSWKQKTKCAILTIRPFGDLRYFAHYCLLELTCYISMVLVQKHNSTLKQLSNFEEHLSIYSLL